MTSTTEPTPVLPPIAKPATRAAVAAAEDVATMADLSSVAPSPLDDVNVESTATLAPGDADDLIARLADEQIDRLLAAEEDGAPPPPPPVAASHSISASHAAVASHPIATPLDLPPPVDRRAPTPDATPAAFPASFSPPGARTAVTPLDAAPADVAAPPPLALPPAPPEPVAPIAVPAAMPAPVDAHDELRSDAAAVAAELADDLARSPSRVAAPSPKPTPAAHDDSPSAMNRAVHAIGVVPTAIVDVINLPVRAANDAIREAIGAIAIVTLANAAALLLYLMIFR